MTDNYDHDNMEENLRLFAMKRAGAARANSVSHHRVVVTLNAAPDRQCPMHGEQGTFHLPNNVPPPVERNSRKEMARELRMLTAGNNRVESNNSFSRRSSSYSDYAYGRSQSLEPTMGHHSHSVPRRFSAAATTAQPANKSVPARDRFKGKVDFKSILRRFDPKDEERGLVRPNDDPRRGATIVDSDFDFRGGASREPCWDNPGRFRGRSGSNTSGTGGVVSPTRAMSPVMQQPKVRPPPLKVDVEAANRIQTMLKRSQSNPVSPRNTAGAERPISPRRVEFGKDVVFDFNPDSSRSAVTSPTPRSQFKPILRYTASDPNNANVSSSVPSLMEQYRQNQQKLLNVPHEDQHQPSTSPLTIQHTNQDTSSGFGFEGTNSSDSLVQIYVPNNDDSVKNHDDASCNNSSSGAETDETIEDRSLGLSSLNPVEESVTLLEGAASTRKIPPQLSDWQRSQSFPAKSGQESSKEVAKILRKFSLPEARSGARIGEKSEWGRNERALACLSKMSPGGELISLLECLHRAHARLPHVRCLLRAWSSNTHVYKCFVSGDTYYPILVRESVGADVNRMEREGALHALARSDSAICYPCAKEICKMCAVTPMAHP